MRQDSPSAKSCLPICQPSTVNQLQLSDSLSTLSVNCQRQHPPFRGGDVVVYAVDNDNNSRATVDSRLCGHRPRRKPCRTVMDMDISRNRCSISFRRRRQGRQGPTLTNAAGSRARPAPRQPPPECPRNAPRRPNERDSARIRRSAWRGVSARLARFRSRAVCRVGLVGRPESAESRPLAVRQAASRKSQVMPLHRVGRLLGGLCRLVGRNLVTTLRQSGALGASCRGLQGFSGVLLMVSHPLSSSLGGRDGGRSSVRRRSDGSSDGAGRRRGRAGMGESPPRRAGGRPRAWGLPRMPIGR